MSKNDEDSYNLTAKLVNFSTKPCMYKESEQSFETSFDMEYWPEHSRKLRLWRAISRIDQKTAAHSVRVGNGAYMMAIYFGLSVESAKQIQEDSWLHDIGRLNPALRHIANLCTDLTAVEREEMNKHPIYGSSYLHNIRLYSAARVAEEHHERWDGRGYPYGKYTHGISLPARIVAIVDDWDALTRDRPYRKALDPQDVFESMSQEFGSAYDPLLYNPFCKMVQMDMLIRNEKKRINLDETLFVLPSYDLEELEVGV